MIEDGEFYEPDMKGLEQPVWAGFAGLDVVRDAAGEFRVLEDNLRMPTGIALSSATNPGECRSTWGRTPSHTPSRASAPVA